MKVHQDVNISGAPIRKRWRLKLVYLLSIESAYVDKTPKNKTVDLCHARLGHIICHKLKMMMNKLILRRLSQLDVRIETMCVGCQYDKAQ